MHINSFAQFWHCWLYQQRNSWGGKYNFGVRMYAFYCKNTENILRKIISWKIISFLCTHFHCTPENLERLTKKKVLRLLTTLRWNQTNELQHWTMSERFIYRVSFLVTSYSSFPNWWFPPRDACYLILCLWCKVPSIKDFANFGKYPTETLNMPKKFFSR